MMSKASTYGVFHPSAAVSPRLSAAENIPMPAMVRRVPTRSNFLRVSRLNGCFAVKSLGTLKTAMTVKMMKMIASSQKDMAQMLSEEVERVRDLRIGDRPRRVK